MRQNHLIVSRRGFLGVAASGGASAFLAACSPSGILNTDDNKPSGASPAQSATLNVSQAMFKINRIRSSHGLSTISVDTRLMKAARSHAKTMLKHGRMGHEFGPSTRFQRRIKAVGFEGAAGENLGVGYRSVDAAIAGWMNSPPHRKIMLRRNFDLGGIGLATRSDGSSGRNNFWVLILGAGGGTHLRSVG